MSEIILFFIKLLAPILGATIAVTLHEFTRAAISHKLGDPLPKTRFRLTLNPFKHIDPFGFILIVATGFGWGKPVATAPSYYKDKKYGIVLANVFPSIINLLVGMLFAGFYKVFIPQSLDIGNPFLALVISATTRSIAAINIGMFLFNIIPVSPLDGSRILRILLRKETEIKYISFEKMLQVILLFLLCTGAFSLIFDPIINIFLKV